MLTGCLNRDLLTVIGWRYEAKIRKEKSIEHLLNIYVVFMQDISVDFQTDKSDKKNQFFIQRLPRNDSLIKYKDVHIFSNVAWYILANFEQFWSVESPK